MQFQKLSFSNAEGHQLAARLDFPSDRKPLAHAVFAHCFTCTKSLNAVVHINRALTKAGIAVLRFDFAGLGESEGDFAATSFASNVSDLVAAAEFLDRDFDAPRLLIGHSLGGAAVLHAAAKIPSCVAVATIGAPFDLGHLARFLDRCREEIPPDGGESRISLGGREFRVKKQFMEDLNRTHMEETLRNLKRALMVFHSPVDTVVGIDNAAQIFKAARHPKSFVSLDQADHLLSNGEDSFYTGSVLACWAQRYIAPPPHLAAARNLADPGNAVRNSCEDVAQRR